jgi:hypothetical protein
MKECPWEAVCRFLENCTYLPGAFCHDITCIRVRQGRPEFFEQIQNGV